MGYQFNSAEGVGDGVQRVAAELVDEALDLLDRRDGPPPKVRKAIHESRKRCKEARGLIRLVRPTIGESTYQATNAAFRDAGRELAPFRDAHALLETFDRAVAVSPPPSRERSIGSVRAELRRRSNAATRRLRSDIEPVERAREQIVHGRELIASFELGDGDWETIAAGFSKTYGRGVNALEGASTDPAAERFHDLRKRVKYSWYHTQLITPTAPELLDALADRWHDLSDALGDAHDLAVLGDQLLDEPEAFGGDASVHAAIELFSDVRRTLEQRSITLGRRLYAETPNQIVRRLGTYWAVWRELGPQLAVGEIDDIFKSDKRFDGYTVPELIAYAGQAGIVGRFSMRRAALVSALTAAGVRPR